MRRACRQAACGGRWAVPTLADVVAAFNAVPDEGRKSHYNGEPWIPNLAESHVQGMARYGNYTLLTYNNKGYSRGNRSNKAPMINMALSRFAPFFLSAAAFLASVRTL